MRLFGEVDGIVDRKDAGWLLLPPFRHERTDPPPLIAGGLTYQMILASLAVWLEGTVGVPENVRVRTSALAEVEARELVMCQIADFESEAHRPGASPGMIECQCEVTCYGGSDEDPVGGGRLADRVLAALQGKTIPLFDYRAEGVPLLGYLKLREGEVSDRSRSRREKLGRVQRAYLVRVPGRAEQV